MKKQFIFTLLIINFITIHASAQLFVGKAGNVNLKGVAAIETITAQSATLTGSLNTTTLDFSFKQPLNNFAFSKGSLQKQHAEENYWEIEDYPNATYKGKIINEVNLKIDGKYQVTVKGVFSIHGVSKDLKIPAILEVKNNVIHIDALYKVFLSDYKIKIPRLMTQKVSDEFEVKIFLELKPAK